MTRLRLSRLASLTIAAACVFVTPALAASAASTPKTAQYGFNRPGPLASVGSNIWVANTGSNSLTEVSANGHFMKLLAGAPFGLWHPRALASAGSYLVAVSGNGAVSVLNGVSGKLVRVVTPQHTRVVDPVAAVVQWPNLFVLSRANSSVTELSVTNGLVIRKIANSPTATNFAAPVAMTLAGPHLWIVNSSPASLTELATSTGAVLGSFSDPSLQLSAPAGVSFDGTNIWVTNSGTNSVTEVTESTGSLVQVINNSSHGGGYGFDAPAATVAHGGFVYVASPPGSSPMVTQISTTTGAANWMMCNTNYPFQFALPTALLLSQGHLWVASTANNALVEMDATSGVLIARFH